MWSRTRARVLVNATVTATLAHFAHMPRDSNTKTPTRASDSKRADKRRRHKRTVSESEGDDHVEVHSSEHASPSTIKDVKATFAFKGPADFDKIRMLGKGGVGRVYLVQLKGTDKLFAMKVLNQKEMIARHKVRRVLTEREVLATIKHPLIVSLYYSFQSHSRLYFVMDYCAGGEFYRTIQVRAGRANVDKDGQNSK